MAYITTPGTTGNMSAGGEYDNFDEVTSAQYPNAAAASAAAAALSAAEAAASATEAAQSVTEIGTAVQDAENAASAAAVSAASASTSATNAAGSASTASNAATNANTSATSAATSAATATTQATNAAGSASSASTSATNASTSATAASTSATSAATSVSNASTSANSANNSAISATASASAASISASNASTSATNAANSASAANTSATNAASSASSASTYATNSSNSAAASATSATASANSATSSANSATASANSATSAASSATSAAASYDSFDDRYLGAKTSDPTVDNDGNALITGAMYFNSTSSIMKVYTGSTWMNTPGIATGGTTGQVLAKLSNTNYDTQWVSLTGGLIYGGTWNASTNTPTLTSSVGTQGTYYVVSVSGTTDLNGITDWIIGDWAIFNGSSWQKIDQTNLVTSVAGRTGNVVLSNTDISGLGTAATQNSTAFATAAQGILADTAIQTLTSIDGSVVISSTGTTRDLSVGVANSTATLISQVRNETGATLTKGTIVYISGAAGNKALVSKALASGDATSAQTFGVVQADINNNQNGYVVVSGLVSNINTSAYADGTQLYLSGTTAGTFTNVKPYAPIHLVYVGIVTYSHATQGVIEVKIQNGYEMDELHNVSAQNPTNGQTLVYNQTTSLWEKANLTAGTGVSVTNGAGSITLANTGVTSITGTASQVTASASTGGITLSLPSTINVNTSGNAATATNVAYSGLTGTVPTWNQDTTGTAAGLSSTLAITSGGTGQTTANAAFNALAPSQTSNSNKYLKTDGTNTSWATVDALPSQTSQSGKYLTTDGTVASWATISLPTQTYTRTTFTATAGQTTFTVNYTAALLQVYLNGVLLDSTDYTATSGTAFVLTSAAALNDIVEAVVYNVINVGQVAASGVIGGTNGYVLTSDGTNGSWLPAPVSLPSQTGNANKFLKTDGTNASWNILPTVLNILSNSSTNVAVSVANGYLPVLNNSGSTINVSVS